MTDRTDTTRAEERKRFEEWYAADAAPSEAGWFERDPFSPEHYRSSYVDEAWLGWAARAGVEAYSDE